MDLLKEIQRITMEAYGAITVFNLLDEQSNDPASEIKAAKETAALIQHKLIAAIEVIERAVIREQLARSEEVLKELERNKK